MVPIAASWARANFVQIDRHRVGCLRSTSPYMVSVATGILPVAGPQGHLQRSIILRPIQAGRLNQGTQPHQIACGDLGLPWDSPSSLSLDLRSRRDPNRGYAAKTGKMPVLLKPRRIIALRSKRGSYLSKTIVEHMVSACVVRSRLKTFAKKVRPTGCRFCELAYAMARAWVRRIHTAPSGWSLFMRALSLRKASISICRTRSRVRPTWVPISLSVMGSSPSRP